MRTFYNNSHWLHCNISFIPEPCPNKVARRSARRRTAKDCPLADRSIDHFPVDNRPAKTVRLIACMRGDCMLGRHVLNRCAQDDGLVQHRTTGEQRTAGFLPNLGTQASCATLTTVRIDHNSRSFLYSYHPTRSYTASQLPPDTCPPRFSRRAGQPCGLPPQTHNPQAPGAP